MHYEYDQVYRYKPRYNADVNQYWICDEGRLSYKVLNENRILEPYVRQGDHQQASDWEAAATALLGFKDRWEGPSAKDGVVGLAAPE